MARISKKTRIRKGKLSKPNSRRCPKCGSEMVKSVCTKCEYSLKTAYRSRREAKEFTFAGD